MRRGDRKRGEKVSWVETYFLKCTCLQFFWPAIVMKKWFNIKAREDEFSADERDTESEFEDEETSCPEKDAAAENASIETLSRFQTSGIPSEHFLRRLKRGKSATMRAQYIDTKEIKILVSTWNVGGKLPPDDLDLEEWLGTKDPADIYVLGFQEVVPLNAGNIFGAENNRFAFKWETLIRRTLNRTQPATPKCKCYSASSSPSRVNACNEPNAIADEILYEIEESSDEDVSLLPQNVEAPPSPSRENASTDSNTIAHDILYEREVLSDEDLSLSDPKYSNKLLKLNKVSSNLGKTRATWPEELLDSELLLKESNIKLKRVNSNFERTGLDCTESLSDKETQAPAPSAKLGRMYSMSEKISMTWPEQPLHSETQDLLTKVGSFKKNHFTQELRNCLETFSVSDAGAIPKKPKKSRACYVRIVSKQMVGIFVSIWVRRNLRRHINNLKVSPVGVGVMGYIGNKGSISVSLSIYQTSFCFVCSHLTSGERVADELRRNADVQEILRRTHFPPVAGVELPQTILEHDRVIWFGDLNYRLNMSDEKTRELVARAEWEKLGNRDQLRKQLRKGCVFDGWFEGLINFAPTYKYELNSNQYFGENVKAGEKRRTPAWCDRILSFGKGMKQLSYNRVEQMLSDHRPVNATFLAEVEIFCRRKLQRALTFTDAELEVEDLPPETEEVPLWQR